ncbi:hypothetical protein NC653_034114 [Populus alba x Populus x berolinensis]|uniref:Uncharacterized protein n=1 Tax=Populus alba x Populus x berolinensis TaxID=444605 RepID=A0AAD6PWR0_9ROSI|nr:hypothetical protein NC653_034114 [Populus alba x Populus x berolinensis]
MCHFTATAYDPSGGDTIDSPSSDEDNHPVAPTTTDSSLNKISKAKGEQRKRKEKGMGMVGKILRMAHLQSILKNVIGVSKSDILLGFTSEGIRWLACRLPHTCVLCYAHSGVTNFGVDI